MATVKVIRGVRAGQVLTFASRAAARRAADKLDRQYGAICCVVQVAS